MGQDPDTIEREIEDRRERIGERIDALSYKADVKSRVGDAITEKRDRLIRQFDPNAEILLIPRVQGG